MSSVSAEAQLKSWFASRSGRALAAMESARINQALTGLRGHQLVQVGDVLPAEPDFELTKTRHQLRMSNSSGAGVLCGSADALPFQTDSVDVLLMPHALELTSDPHQVLREAHRVLTPEGHLILSGFNPWSLAGIAKLLRRRREIPWAPRWLSAGRVGDWLALLGFEPLVSSPIQLLRS